MILLCDSAKGTRFFKHISQKKQKKNSVQYAPTRFLQIDKPQARERLSLTLQQKHKQEANVYLMAHFASDSIIHHRKIVSP